jgi:ubiquinone/menaquinone biosynthesis C-methylase UbiE
MSRFGHDPRAFFDEVYRASAPWDIGAAQPNLIALLEEFPPDNPIVDVGCGPGDLAIALATRGYDVVGVDFVESAIRQANERAGSLDAEVQERLRFEVADALRPSTLGEAVGAVADSGFMHLFETDVRDRFAAELATVLQPGGRYYVLAFAVTFPIENAPLEMTAAEIAARFTADRGWRLRACRPAEFRSRVGTVAAVAACVERIAIK